MEALSGTDAQGNDNFSGWSLEALKDIYEERNASVNGHETLDTDTSVVAAAAGAVVIVAYPRFEGATGLPARVWAITE